MKRKKLIKYKEFRNLKNIFEHTSKNFLNETNKLISQFDNVIMELGCGRGEYIIELAKKYPQSLCIGIDIKGDRLWYGAKTSLNLNNLYFFRMKIEDIDTIFPINKVDEIWLTFPDPFPKRKQEKNRITSKLFLLKYKKILNKNHNIYLKTDNLDFLNFSINSIKGISGKILNRKNGCKLKIQSHFEKKHLKNNRKIYNLHFIL